MANEIHIEGSSPKKEEQELQRLNISDEVNNHKKTKEENMEKEEKILDNEVEKTETLQEDNASTEADLLSKLDAKHIADFEASRITKKTLKKCVVAGLLSSINKIEDEPQYHISKHVSGSGWLMKHPNTGFHTFKPDKPRKNDNGRIMKYENPFGQTIEIFIPLGFDWNADEIIITEGIKKAIKAVQEGYNAISISGIWNWRSKKSTDGINPSFKKFVEKLLSSGKQSVYLCFDNDVMLKDSVKMALTRLSVYLLQNEIVPKVIKLPFNKGAKLGLDDYLLLKDADLGKLIMQAKVMPEALLELAIENRNMRVGQSVNINYADFSDEIKALYQKLPEDFYTAEHSVYNFCKKGGKNNKYGVFTKKTDFDFVLEYNAITITQSVATNTLFNRQLLIKSKDR